jgi:diaminohydroxyphosphoribosylaminopyrimidine deaminase/5-amino-6-(5-phosphoribosylamino)uracil reductase
VLVAAGREAPQAERQRLEQAGCEVLACQGEGYAARLDALLEQFGRRRMTNLLVEGGSRLLGSLWDAGQLDEVHVFIAPKLLGGAAAPSPIAGKGIEGISQALSLQNADVQQVGSDVYVRARVASN